MTLDRSAQISHDQQLLVAALAGERGAADRLFREITPHLRTIVRRRVPESEADDVLAELVASLWAGGWRKLRHWRQDAPLAHYLSVIAVNHCQDANKRRRRRLGVVSENGDFEVEPISSDPAAEREIAVAQAADCLRNGIAGIAPMQKTILRLRHIEELAHAAIAERLNKTMGYVAGTLSRAEKALVRSMTKPCLELVGDILRFED